MEPAPAASDGRREGRSTLPEAIAWLASVSALLHVAYAASGGIADPPALSWALALGTVTGAAMAWRSALRGPTWLAGAALPLLWLPVLWAWPAPAVSLPGLVVLGLLVVLTLAMLVQAALALARRGRA